MNIPLQAEQALSILQSHFADSLIAVYLHGSSVTSELRPASDIDLLVVINQSMTEQSREHLIHCLMGISGLYPIDPEGRRPVEVAIFLMSELAQLAYPARCELIYGEWLRTDYEHGVFEGPTQDPEFTLMLAQAEQEAVCLWKKGTYYLPVISQNDIKQAVLDACPNLLLSLEGDERNVLLTLARMWYTMETGKFASKDTAASWAMNLMPIDLASVLNIAQTAYINGSFVDWDSQRTVLTRCVNYLSQRIGAFSKI